MTTADGHDERTRTADGHDERTRLLASRPPSYNAASTDAESDTDAASNSEHEQASKEVTRADLIWVLAGLWSAVFLGALDGVSHAKWIPLVRRVR